MKRIILLATVTALMAVISVVGAPVAFAKGQPLYTCEWSIGGTHSIANVIPKTKAYYERTFEAVCVRQDGPV
jgi:hypothetical protein